jgi:O-antigen/teichoic acid export membrane protein
MNRLIHPGDLTSNSAEPEKVSLLAGGISGIIGIAMAVADFGVWSLVAQQVSNSFFQTVFLWFFNPWRPSLFFSFQSLQEMFGFGSRLLASGLLNQIFDSLYYVVIGRMFSAAALGFFTCAMALAELPSRPGDRCGDVSVFPPSNDPPD